MLNITKKHRVENKQITTTKKKTANFRHKHQQTKTTKQINQQKHVLTRSYFRVRVLRNGLNVVVGGFFLFVPGVWERRLFVVQAHRRCLSGTLSIFSGRSLWRIVDFAGVSRILQSMQIQQRDQTKNKNKKSAKVFNVICL